MAGRKLPFHPPFTKDFSAEEKSRLGFGFRLDNERFRVLEKVPLNHSCVARRLKHTPYFPETISRLAGFLGQSKNLGRNIGLDGKAKSREILSDSRTILREV